MINKTANGLTRICTVAKQNKVSKKNGAEMRKQSFDYHYTKMLFDHQVYKWLLRKQRYECNAHFVATHELMRILGLNIDPLVGAGYRTYGLVDPVPSIYLCNRYSKDGYLLF